MKGLIFHYLYIYLKKLYKCKQLMHPVPVYSPSKIPLTL